MRFLIIFIFTTVLFAACQAPEKERDLPSLPTDGIATLYDSTLWPFYHGVASGDPLQDRVIIWTRVTPKDSLNEISVSWEVSDGPGFENIINEGSTITSPDKDYTVKVDVDKLSPGTQYYYRFKALNKESIIGRTRTAPKSAEKLNIAVVSCSNYQFGPFYSYGELAKQPVDVVLHLGDYIYEYGAGTYGNSSRTHLPEGELMNLSDYRIRYSQYRLDSGLREAHSSHPFITIWDDHEIANNSYKDGAQNHQPEEGDYEIRKAAAKQAYYEWLPVRESNELYRSFDYGNIAEIIMLDERLAGRTAPPDSLDDPKIDTTRMLGEEQLDWFIEELTQSKAQWKVIGNQVIFSYLNWGRESFSINLDSWDGYPMEREKIKKTIIENNLENVVFVTGDTHSSWAFEVTDKPFTEYNPETSEGAFAVEFGTTSINSGNSNESFSTDTVKMHEMAITNSPINPHLKYSNLRDHGFMVLSLNKERAKATWYYVDLENPDSEIKTHSVATMSNNNSLSY